MTNNSLTAE